MITRRKTLIILSGNRQDALMPLLANHEAIVEVSSPDNLSPIWKKNKTPIIRMSALAGLPVDKTFAGDVLILNSEMFSSTFQPDVTEEFTSFCYNYSVEPGEFKIPNTANNSSDGCLFCNITHHNGLTTEEYNLRSKVVDMVIYESEHFVVVPGLGPLASGYLMIMTKPHYLSLAQVPEEWYDEYHEIEQDIEYILKKMYHKDVCFYEHGTGPNGAVGLKSIVHMHVHVMIDAPLSDMYKNMFCMHPLDNIKKLSPISYFTYKQHSDGELWVTDDPDVYLQRQVHRQVYAEEHNLAKGQFNWRKVPFDDMTLTNVWQLYLFLSSDAPISERIKERTNSFVIASAERFKK